MRTYRMILHDPTSSDPMKAEEKEVKADLYKKDGEFIHFKVNEGEGMHSRLGKVFTVRAAMVVSIEEVARTGETGG